MQDLWDDAIPLVKFTLSNLLNAGKILPEQMTEDLLQDCYVAAGAALSQWDARRASLSTFLIPRIRGAALDHLRSRASGMVGGLRAPGQTQPLRESLTSSDLAALDRLIAREDRDRLALALQKLDLEELYVLSLYYGLNGSPKVSLNAIAQTWKTNKTYVFQTLQRALKRMRMMLSRPPSDSRISSHAAARHARL